METIKNYLESMFRNLPNTSEVIKAKNELLQMMEDKYTELRREGKTENEASFGMPCSVLYCLINR